MSAATLFTPHMIGGGVRLRNRVVMAPMTRQRATDDGVPTRLMRTYFAQRASAGLILTDCTMVSPLSRAYENCRGPNSWDATSFYGGDAQGYVDYPSLPTPIGRSALEQRP